MVPPAQGAQGSFEWGVFTKNVVGPALGVSAIGMQNFVYGLANVIGSMAHTGTVRGICRLFVVCAAVHLTVFGW